MYGLEPARMQTLVVAFTCNRLMSRISKQAFDGKRYPRMLCGLSKLNVDFAGRLIAVVGVTDDR
jgi:hypothetical protein